MFKLWSEATVEAKKILKLDFGLRNWDALTLQEKIIIWQHVDWFFFDKDIIKMSQYEYGYKFHGGYSEEELKKERVFQSIILLNEMYKAQNFAPNFLEDHSINNACKDFFSIFINSKEDVVLELLSIYSKQILIEREKGKLDRESAESEAVYIERIKEWQFEEFDSFTERINDVFEDFGIDVLFTRGGIIKKQDKKITEEIYVPVLNFLSDSRWKEVNTHLSAAFNYYRIKDYSSTITNTISAVQAYLQLLVKGKVGTGNVSQLIVEAQKKSLIPNDSSTRLIFDNIESIFARERQEKSSSHPRVIDPSEENARLVMNLAMVFLQHCIQVRV